MTDKILVPLDTKQIAEMWHQTRETLGLNPKKVKAKMTGRKYQLKKGEIRRYL
jgi:hypothetical protein